MYCKAEALDRHCPEELKLSVPSSSPAWKSSLPSAKAWLKVVAVAAAGSSRSPGEGDRPGPGFGGGGAGAELQGRDLAELAGKRRARHDLGFGEDVAGSEVDQSSCQKICPAPSWRNSIAPPLRRVPEEASGRQGAAGDNRQGETAPVCSAGKIGLIETKSWFSLVRKASSKATVAAPWGRTATVGGSGALRSRPRRWPAPKGRAGCSFLLRRVATLAVSFSAWR